MIALGAIIALVGAFLPWVTAGEIAGRVVTSNGFSGTGVLVFLASAGLLVLILLPYASSSGRSALDRPVMYALLAGLAIAGLVIRVVDLWTQEALKLLPLDRAPGLWLAIVGCAIVALGVGELLGERPPGSPLRTRR
jgi:hypothetical protein